MRHDRERVLDEAQRLVRSARPQRGSCSVQRKARRLLRIAGGERMAHDHRQDLRAGVATGREQLDDGRVHGAPARRRQAFEGECAHLLV